MALTFFVVPSLFRQLNCPRMRKLRFCRGHAPWRRMGNDRSVPTLAQPQNYGCVRHHGAGDGGQADSHPFAYRATWKLQGRWIDCTADVRRQAFQRDVECPIEARIAEDPVVACHRPMGRRGRHTRSNVDVCWPEDAEQWDGIYVDCHGPRGGTSRGRQWDAGNDHRHHRWLGTDDGLQAERCCIAGYETGQETSGHSWGQCTNRQAYVSGGTTNAVDCYRDVNRRPPLDQGCCNGSSQIKVWPTGCVVLEGNVRNGDDRQQFGVVNWLQRDRCDLRRSYRDGQGRGEPEPAVSDTIDVA